MGAERWRSRQAMMSRRLATEYRVESTLESARIVAEVRQLLASHTTLVESEKPDLLAYRWAVGGSLFFIDEGMRHIRSVEDEYGFGDLDGHVARLESTFELMRRDLVR